MKKHSKRFFSLKEKIEQQKDYLPAEAIKMVKEVASAKFDETVELSIRLGIDPKRSDQVVRGTVVLPHGTGKKVRILAFAKGAKAKEAQEAGADWVGEQEYIDKVKEGWNEFDVVVATPDMMGAIGKTLGRILGPRMPNPKAGTLSMNIGDLIKEIKAGKVQYKADKYGIINMPIGKVSFGEEKLYENMAVVVDAILKAKPASAKGQYFKSVYLSPTMGPSIKVNSNSLYLMTESKA